MRPRSVVGYVGPGRDFLRWLADDGSLDDLRAVRPQLLDAYAASLIRRGYAEKTRRRHLAALRLWFRFLVSRGDLLVDPAATLAAPRLSKRSAQTLPRVLSLAEIERLVSAASALPRRPIRARAIVELLYSTGLRLAECTALELGDLDLEGGLCLVRSGKGGRDRRVPLGTPACAALRAWLVERETRVNEESGAALWLNRSGGPLSRVSIWESVRAALRAACLDHKATTHTLRHTAATHLLAGGAGVRHVQAFLGHARLSTTAIYTHVAPADLEAAYRKAFPRQERAALSAA